MFILKKNLLQNQQANFNQTWHESSLGKGNSKLFKCKANTLPILISNKGPGTLQRGDNHKIAKMGLGHLKIFFFRTTQPE
jgi:hypothetical protein